MVFTLVPFVRHIHRSLSVLQGELSILYSCANFESVHNAQPSRIGASTQSAFLQYMQNAVLWPRMPLDTLCPRMW